VTNSEKFGKRIARIRVVVVKIWQKEFIGTYLEFLEVARAIFGYIFKNQGSSWKFVDCGLIVEKGRGLTRKMARISNFKLFPNSKCRGLGPCLMDQRRARSMVDRPPWPTMELTGAQPSGRSGPQRLATRWEKGGYYRDSILPSTEAWEAAHRRWSFGSGWQQGGRGED
jgi:hypothetical protein